MTPVCEGKAPGESPRKGKGYHYGQEPERKAAGTQGKHTHWEGPARGAVPAGMEVAQGKDHIAAHGAHDGPLATTRLDEDRWEEHGGHQHRGIECAERRHPQALRTVEAALWMKDKPSEEGTIEGTGSGEETRYC